MPYVTGVANSAADLRSAVIGVATAHGWTWDAAHEVLHKGSVFGRLTVSGARLEVQCALGYSGTTLVSPSGQISCIREFTGDGSTPLSYPVTYHVFLHENPNDIWVSINYAVVWWQHLAFGIAASLGSTPNPLWQFATSWDGMRSDRGVAVNTNGGSGSGSGNTSGVPFWRSNDVGQNYCSMAYVQTEEGEGWRRPPASSTTATTQNAIMSAYGVMAGALLPTQPNAWNGESVLVRAHVAVGRPSNFLSMWGELANLRLVRNDNLRDGQILTIGHEKWFTVPVYRKNVDSRDQSPYNSANHSGTLGFAIRYDGP